MQTLRSLYKLKVSLEQIEPPIWRMLLIPSSTPLPVLHEILQVAMGWKNCHLHQFLAGNVRYIDG